MGIRCWWFGCEPHPQDCADPEFIECRHCGEIVSYEHLVGLRLYNDVKKFCRHWFFRKWIPKKCWACGHRWKKCDESFDHIPF